MANEAINKIKAEIDKEKNPYVQVVGQFLINHLKQHLEDADKILDKDKTIMKSLNEMRKVAAKTKVGNVAVLTDDEGFKIVLKYFGMEGSQAAEQKVHQKRTVPEKKNEDQLDLFDVKLEDFM